MGCAKNVGLGIMARNNIDCVSGTFGYAPFVSGEALAAGCRWSSSKHATGGLHLAAHRLRGIEPTDLIVILFVIQSFEKFPAHTIAVGIYANVSLVTKRVQPL